MRSVVRALLIGLVLTTMTLSSVEASHWGGPGRPGFHHQQHHGRGWGGGGACRHGRRGIAGWHMRRWQRRHCGWRMRGRGFAFGFQIGGFGFGFSTM